MKKNKMLVALEKYSKKKITRPLDSCVDYNTTVGEYYEEEVEEIKHKLQALIRMVERR